MNLTLTTLQNMTQRQRLALSAILDLLNGNHTGNVQLKDTQLSILREFWDKSLIGPRPEWTLLQRLDLLDLLMHQHFDGPYEYEPPAEVADIAGMFGIMIGLAQSQDEAVSRINNRFEDLGWTSRVKEPLP